MLVKSVYDLDVFRRAYGLSLNIHKTSLGFAKIEQFGGLADQMRRCSKGICANMVEGLGRGSTVADRKHFLRMALGSVAEARLWCRYALDLGYIKNSQYESWRAEYDEIGKMLQGLLKRQA